MGSIWVDQDEEADPKQRIRQLDSWILPANEVSTGSASTSQEGEAEDWEELIPLQLGVAVRAHTASPGDLSVIAQAPYPSIQEAADQQGVDCDEGEDKV